MAKGYIAIDLFSKTLPSGAVSLFVRDGDGKDVLITLPKRSARALAARINQNIDYSEGRADRRPGTPHLWFDDLTPCERQLMSVDLEALRRRAEAVRSRIYLSDLIGGDVSLTKRGHEHVGLCPFHSDASLGSFSVNDAKAIFKCFACGASGDHFKYLEKRKGMTFVQALKMLEADAGIDFTSTATNAEYDRAREKRLRAAMADAEKRKRNARGLWHHSAVMQGTPAQLYLEGRGIDFAALGRFPGAIRFRHDCWNTELGREIPAMVTAMTVLAGEMVAAHRTYLEFVRGRWVKADLDMPKMTLGDYAGAHIALNKGEVGRMPLRDVPEGTTVHISEGIEDGLTVAMADPAVRLIAAATLGNIGAVDLPDSVSDVVMVGQRDEEDRALRALAARRAGDEALAQKHEDAAMKINAAFNSQIAAHQARGRTVLCMWPDDGFKDFNDQLRSVRMAA